MRPRARCQRLAAHLSIEVDRKSMSRRDPPLKPLQVALHHVPLVHWLTETMAFSRVRDELNRNFEIGQRLVNLGTAIDVARAVQEQGGSLRIHQTVSRRMFVVDLPGVPGLPAKIGPHGLTRTLAGAVPTDPIGCRSADRRGLEPVRVANDPGAEISAV